MTVYIYVVGANFSKRHNIVILREVIFNLLVFILIKRKLSLYLCCKVGFMSIPGDILFLALHSAACSFHCRS